MDAEPRLKAAGPALTGRYRVRVFRPAWHEARKWCPRTRDTVELRSHALKLRFWPDPKLDDEAGQLLDLNWEWIKALKGSDVGELRIDDVIGGHDNLRIIFFRGDPKVGAPLPIIWVIGVFQKKRDDFTRQQLQVMKARSRIVKERFYRDREHL